MTKGNTRGKHETLPAYASFFSVIDIPILIQLFLTLFYSLGLLLKHVPGFGYWTGGYLASKACMDN
jgi:hypothetical protein